MSPSDTEDDELGIPKEDPDEDQILAAIGNWGRWQTFCFAIMSLPVIVTSYPILIMTFMNAKVDFWCGRPENLQDLEVNKWREVSGQSEANCQIFNTSFSERGRDILSEVNGSLVPCTTWEYDTSKFRRTVSSEFNLVCDREFLLSVGQTVFFFGMLCGGPISGVLSDRYGRKPVLIVMIMLLSLSGITASAAPTYGTLLAARFFSALGAVGFMISMTYMLEMSGGRWTTFVGIGVEFYWVAGWLSLGALAFVVTDWRELLLATSIPGLLIVLYCWIIPESPRWLSTVGRRCEAEKVARKIASFNRNSLPDDWKLKCGVSAEEATSDNASSVLDLFSTPQVRAKTLIIYGNWFVNSLTYYGLTLNSAELGGDFHVNYMINGALEIVAYTVAMFIVERFGRRIPYATSLALSGTLLLCVTLIPKSLAHFVVAAAIVGKFFITVSFAIVYMFSTELFPTVLRTTGIGTSVMVSKVGGMSASWIALLRRHHVFLPTTIYGTSALVFAALALALPETKGKKIPDTVDEGEKRKLIMPKDLFKPAEGL